METLRVGAARRVGERRRPDPRRQARCRVRDGRCEGRARAVARGVEAGEEPDQVVVARRGQARPEPDELDRLAEDRGQIVRGECPALAVDPLVRRPEPRVGRGRVVAKERAKARRRRPFAGQGPGRHQPRRQPARDGSADRRQARGGRQQRGPDRGAGEGHREPGVEDGHHLVGPRHGHPGRDPQGPQVRHAVDEEPAGNPTDLVDRDHQEVVVRLELDVDRRPMDADDPSPKRPRARRELGRPAGRRQGHDGVRQGGAPMTEGRNGAIVGTLG